MRNANLSRELVAFIGTTRIAKRSKETVVYCLRASQPISAKRTKTIPAIGCSGECLPLLPIDAKFPEAFLDAFVSNTANLGLGGYPWALASLPRR